MAFMPINDKELGVGKKMAQRKAGVTAKDLSEKLGCSVPRAKAILRRVGCEEKRAEKSRALVFSL